MPAENNGKIVPGWSLRRQDWQTLDKILDGRVTSKVHFAKMSLPLIPESSGIYVICLRPVKNGAGFLGHLYNSLYVGQSNNLRKRCKEHLSGGTAVEDLKNTFPLLDFWYVVCESDDMNFLEKKIYDVLSPVSNRISPPLSARVGLPTSANPQRKK